MKILEEGTSPLYFERSPLSSLHCSIFKASSHQNVLRAQWLFGSACHHSLTGLAKQGTNTATPERPPQPIALLTRSISMYAITKMPLFVGKGNVSQVLITRRNRGKSGLRLPLTDKYHLATADVAYTLHTDKSSEFEVELASRYLGAILTVIQSHLGRRQHIGLHVNELQFSCATKSGIDKLNCTPTPLRPSVYAL